eukprot:1140639-Pelagomonas_calceolata.AAC.5
MRNGCLTSRVADFHATKGEICWDSGLLFTAALPQDAAQYLIFKHSFGNRLPGLLPNTLPQGIEKTILSSAWFTRLRRVYVNPRPLDVTIKSLLSNVHHNS